MKTVKIFLTLALFCIASGNVHAQKFMKKLLNNGTSEDAVLDTMKINLDAGVVFYPCNKVDGKFTVQDFMDFSKCSEERIFINAMLYSVNQAERGREHITQVDATKKQFSVTCQKESAFYPENSTYYKYTETFRAMDNNFSFCAMEASVGYTHILGEVKETAFEKLDGERKAKHKNYINEMAALNSVFLNEMFKYIESNTPKKVTHWDEIEKGIVVKGMNETECLLAIGKPMHNRNNGKQTKWMVNNDFVIIFENGIVTRVIN